MTIEEAIEHLITVKEYYTSDRDFTPWGEDYEPLVAEEKQAIDKAVETLEKQIPKKVKIQFREMGGVITCFETDVCPTCGDDFYIDDLGQTMYYSFCPNCGQALDWSEKI